MTWRWTIAACSAVCLGCASAPSKVRGPERWQQEHRFAIGRPSERTRATLRAVDLEADYARDPEGTRRALAEHFASRPRRPWAYALAELSLLEAEASAAARKPDAADRAFRAMRYAYAFLFAPQIVEPLNDYDPQTRLACDLYNDALALLIEGAQRRAAFDPRGRMLVEAACGRISLPVTTVGFDSRQDEIRELVWTQRPRPSELGREVRSFGLGVPMVGVRKDSENAQDDAGAFAVGDRPVAVTVLMRPDVTCLFDAESDSRSREMADEADALHRRQERMARGETCHDRGAWRPQDAACTVELLDPLVRPEIVVGDRRAPVEAEFSAPIVHALRQTSRIKLDLLGFLDPGQAEKKSGLVMLQPYQKGKIPVVFVHGLLSDPLTWTEMFNELGSDPEIRAHFQFWAFYYPTGLPFLKSAARLREDLQRVRECCDPNGADPALWQTVLVGHSMGGLISKLQTVSSREDYWKLISKRPFDEIKASPETREKLRRVFYFEPQESVARVVYIGSPHRGSTFSKALVGRLGSWLVRIPSMTMQLQQQLLRDNPDAFFGAFSRGYPTSVDLLAVDSPVLQTMYDETPRVAVKQHVILGDGVDMGRLGPGDGVVPASSAQAPGAVSELRIPARHETIHRHPRATLEVNRILRRHYREALAEGRLQPIVPAAYSTAETPGAENAAASSQVRESVPPVTPNSVSASK